MTENFTAEQPPAINTHVVVNDPLGTIPAITGWVTGHGHQDTAPRGPVVLVIVDEEWQRTFTGPCTVSCLPIRPEFLAPVEVPHV